jgi:hypothetical protein
MANIYNFCAGAYAASQAQLVRQNGSLLESEQLQRKIVFESERKFGRVHVVTAAALFDLVLTLEMSGSLRQAQSIRREIRAILDELDRGDYPQASGQ